MDKDCALFDRRAENAMRPLLAEFIGWLTSAEYDDEEAYGAEGEEAEESKGISDAATEEEKKGESAETDA